MFSMLDDGLLVNDPAHSSNAYAQYIAWFEMYVGKSSDHKFSLETNMRKNGTNLFQVYDEVENNVMRLS